MGTHWETSDNVFTGTISGQFETKPVFCGPFSFIDIGIEWSSLNENAVFDIYYCRDFQYSKTNKWVKVDELVIDIDETGNRVFGPFKPYGQWVKIVNSSSSLNGVVEIDVCLRN